jgi:hypothetical protein
VLKKVKLKGETEEYMESDKRCDDGCSESLVIVFFQSVVHVESDNQTRQHHCKHYRKPADGCPDPRENAQKLALIDCPRVRAREKEEAKEKGKHVSCGGGGGCVCVCVCVCVCEVACGCACGREGVRG